MSSFFKKEYEQLDEKISELEKKLNGLKYNLWEPHIRQDWEEIFELMKEIQEDFNSTHYPTKQLRESAWSSFCETRNEAYEKKRERNERVSDQHKDNLLDKLGGLEYWTFRDGLRLMFFTELNELKAEVIEKGRKTTAIANEFSALKREMNRDDKDEVFNRIKEIRDSHDEFFEQYNFRSSELREEREEKQREYQERSQLAKDKVLENTELNREKLEKAEDALERMERAKSDLEDKIDKAYSDNYRERHQEWLDELEDKIADKERYIQRLKEWIEEGEDKLRNWN
jgi:DNA repair exonuclease SbcCD ATPase subunit